MCWPPGRHLRLIWWPEVHGTSFTVKCTWQNSWVVTVTYKLPYWCLTDFGGRHKPWGEDGAESEHKGHSGTWAPSFREKETLEMLTLKRLDICHCMSSWPISSTEKSGLGRRMSHDRNCAPTWSPREGVLRKKNQGWHLGRATADSPSWVLGKPTLPGLPRKS